VNHVAFSVRRFPIACAERCRLWGYVLHINQVFNNLFCVDEMENSAIKVSSSDCEHSPVRGGGCWIGRAEDVSTVPGPVPVNPGLAVADPT
jgi:hypothetical protein